jgi:hypothetical protein
VTRELMGKHIEVPNCVFVFALFASDGVGHPLPMIVHKLIETMVFSRFNLKGRECRPNGSVLLVKSALQVKHNRLDIDRREVGRHRIVLLFVNRREPDILAWLQMHLLRSGRCVFDIEEASDKLFLSVEKFFPGVSFGLAVSVIPRVVLPAEASDVVETLGQLRTAYWTRAVHLSPLFNAHSAKDMATRKLNRVFGMEIHGSETVRLVADAAAIIKWVKTVLAFWVRVMVMET